MKKVFFLFMALFFVFSLTSCSVARGMPLADENEALSEGISAVESTEEPESKVSPLFWRVTSKDSKAELWLFGSFGVADLGTYPLPNTVL